MLDEEQLSARPQHTHDLGERSRRVRHGAEHERRNDSVERVVEKRERLGSGRDDAASQAGCIESASKPRVQQSVRL
jgi:hypothetical protein